MPDYDLGARDPRDTAGGREGRSFDFEARDVDGLDDVGGGVGQRPVGETRPGQDLVFGATGQRFATSMHGGDAAIGRVTSPVFALDGAKLTLRIGGGTDATKLRVELWVDDAIVKTASVAAPGGDGLRVVTLELGTCAASAARWCSSTTRRPATSTSTTSGCGLSHLRR